MVCVFVRFSKILLRFLVEGFLTTERAKIISLPFILRCASSGCGVNIHAANGIMYCSCHRLSPFVGFDYHVNRPLHREPYYSISYRHNCLYKKSIPIALCNRDRFEYLTCACSTSPAINEPRFAIQNAADSDDFEVQHHPLVFMLELMAVHEIPAPVSIKADEDLNRLTIVKQNSIFPAMLPWEENPAPASA